MKERVHKLMAQAGIASRRACEAMIRQGRVRINGQTAVLGDKADAHNDVIEVDGERLKLSDGKRIYIAYNKPINVLSTNEAHPGDDRPTVRDMIPVEGHLFTVGRLDVESEGLMLLTNDGELANKLAHPRYEHTKTYRVVVYGRPSEETLETWQRGIELEDGRTAPCYVKITDGHDKDTTTLRVVMIEGKKRQIRRIASNLGHPVRKLMRTHIGQLGLGELRLGEWRDLKKDDVALLTTPAPELEAIRRRRKAIQASRKPVRAARKQPGPPPKVPSRARRPAAGPRTSVTRKKLPPR